MSIPKMNYPQYRKARRLTRECCNNVGGNCLLLDDGEECICVQSISYSLLCRWFRAAVLPLDESLCAALLHQENRKKCVRCGELYVPKSNRNPTGRNTARIAPGRRSGKRPVTECADIGLVCNALGAKKPWYFKAFRVWSIGG